MGNQVIADLARQAIRQGLSVRIWANGVSMFPYIWPGDMVTFRPLGEAETIKVGAVAVVEPDGQDKFVLHRVVRQDGARVITRGDSNMTEDAPHTLTQILGVLTKVESSRFHISWHVDNGHGLWAWWMLNATPVSHCVNHAFALAAQKVNSLLKRLGLRRERKTLEA